MTTESFKDLYRAAGLQLRDVRDVFRVSPATVRRWQNGTCQPPEAVLIVLRTLAEGLHHLPGVGNHWNGWVPRGDGLYDPACGDYAGRHTPGSIRAWSVVSQELADMRAKENRANRPVSHAGNVVRFPGTLCGGAHAITARLHSFLAENKA